MLLKNGTLLTLSPPGVERADLRIAGGEIIERATRLRPSRREETADLSGKFIMLGMVNAHTHLYSSLARGMPSPRQQPENFVDMLRKVWWKLDRALDEESIYYSALTGSIEAARFGTTTLIDHHASPNCIKGSLDVIKQAMSDVGLRGILCYETTDRDGRKRSDEGLEENERFVSENRYDVSFKGAIGAHASFTLSNKTMRALGNLADKYGTGVHIHVAESRADVDDAKMKRKVDIIDRLTSFGILSRKSILAHGVHLSKSHRAVIKKSGAWLVHNPRSNMNNAVGYAPLRWFGKNSALGTDGFPADMFEESKIGFFRNRESEHKVGFRRLPAMLHAGQRIVATYFGREFGKLSAGAPADLIVLHYASPTPLTAANLPGHFLFGMNSGFVESVMVNGQWRMFNRQLIGIDEGKVMTEAAKVAEKLWKRMQKF